MILQNILKYRNGSNFAHTLLNTIKSSDANPPENFFFLIMLIVSNQGVLVVVYLIQILSGIYIQM